MKTQATVTTAAETVTDNLYKFRMTASLHQWEELAKAADRMPMPTPEDLQQRHAAMEITDCITLLAEDAAPDQRVPYTNTEVMNAIEANYGLGFESGIAEMIHLYSKIHPSERRTVFQLAEIAGYIQQTREMEIFREQHHIQE